jgi:hypothetical protein
MCEWLSFPNAAIETNASLPESGYREYVFFRGIQFVGEMSDGIEDLYCVWTLGAHTPGGVSIEVADVGAIDRGSVRERLCSASGFLTGDGMTHYGSGLRLDAGLVLLTLLRPEALYLRL